MKNRWILADVPEVKSATDNYRGEEDKISAFLEQETKDDENQVIKLTDLMNEYKVWLVENGYKGIPSVQRFQRELPDKYMRKKVTGATYIKGIRLKTINDRLMEESEVRSLSDEIPF